MNKALQNLITFFKPLISLTGGVFLGILVPELIRWADHTFEKKSYEIGDFLHSSLNGNDCVYSYYTNASKYDQALANLRELAYTWNTTGAISITNYQNQLSDALTAYKDLKKVYFWCSGVSANDSVDRERLEYVNNLLTHSNNIKQQDPKSVSLRYEISKLAADECHNLYKHVSSNRSNDVDEVYNTFNHKKRAKSYRHVAERCIGVKIRDGKTPSY